MPRNHKIIIRNGTTTPNAADFDTAEPAWDKTAGKLYIKDGAGSMVEVGAGGGGGLTHFVESEETASPNATVPVDALTATDASYTNIDVALVAKGTGATLAQVPDGTTAGGNKRGTYATDWQKTRNSANRVASGNFSAIGGGQSNIASGAYSAIGGGYSNTASGSGATVAGGDVNTASGSVYPTIAGGTGNTASSNYSFVGGGQSNRAQTNTHAAVCGGGSNTASGQNSFVGGGFGNTASGLYTAVTGGYSNIASGPYSFVSGGRNNRTTGDYSFIGGGRNGITRSIAGNHVFPACFNPIADTAGVTQAALLVLARETTGATATVLTSNSSAAGTTNQVILPNNSAYSFSGEVIAGVTAAGATARWTIDGAIKRGANAASTAMVGTPTVTMTHFDAGAATWSVAVTADTTNGGIKVEVTGAAATTIRWVCKINTTEMTY